MTLNPLRNPAAPLAALALLSLFSGCDDSPPEVTADMGQQQQDMGGETLDAGPCDDAGAVVRYRITALHIPTPDEAGAGATVGHNVDGAGDTCGVPDYPGGVDNSLIDLAAALPALAPDDPIDLQAEIDNALNCPANADPSECTRLDLIVSVQSGTSCVIVEVEDGEGGNLAGPFVASRDGSGNLRGQVASLSLAIPYQTDTGSVNINLEVTNVVLTANLSASTLSSIVLGGSLERSAFEQTIMDLLPLLGDEIEFEDIGPILANLYDVQISGVCAALSVGLTGTATLQEAL